MTLRLHGVLLQGNIDISPGSLAVYTLPYICMDARMHVHVYRCACVLCIIICVQMYIAILYLLYF